MQKVKQVVRLYGQGKGAKAISSSLAIARNTIKKYLQIFIVRALIMRHSSR